MKTEPCEITQAAIDLFIEMGRKLDGVYDLLLRGSGMDYFVPQWSDLDLSIVVDKINLSITDEVQKIYRQIRAVFPYKVSIALVSRADFLASWHHHGIKPVYYSFILQQQESLLKEVYYSRDIHHSKELKIDCIANLAYLIHDLRSKYLSCGEDFESKIEFCVHLIKRTKHMVRNGLFVLEGSISEDINEELFSKHFPSVDPDFLENLKNYKKNWEALTLSQKRIQEIIAYIYPIVEQIYETMIPSFETFPETL